VITGSLDLVLVILAALGGSLVLGGIAKGLGLDVPNAMLVGGGLPLLVAAYWHARVTADERAAYVRATDASTQAKLASVTAPEPAPDAPEQPDDDALDAAWRLSLRRFFHNGEVAGGFSHRKLESTMTEDAWTVLTTFYASDDGGRVLRLTPAGYVLGYGWDHDTVRQKITRQTLPHPPGDPPDVAVLPDDASRRDARRQKATA
jgi:hypothetical protein